MLELRRRIELAQTALAAMPDGPVYGDVKASNSRAECEIGAWRDVLRVMDGGRFGMIDLWSSNELPSYQSTPLPVGGPTDHFIIGQITYEPLVIERDTGEVLWLAHAFSQYASSPVIRLGQPVEFVMHSVFGPGYGKLDDAPDDWLAFLRDQGFA